MKFHRIIFIILSLSILSCGKIENSNSTDKFTYGDAPAVTGSIQFIEAATAINKRCAFCHTHAQWKNYSEVDYIANGLAVSQSPADSPIYYRNQNATSGAGPKNMPINGNPVMNANELNAVLAWINSF
jgi:uncharacterized membrane protein